MIYHDKRTKANFNIRLLASMAFVSTIFFCFVKPNQGSIVIYLIWFFALLVILFGYRYYYMEINDDGQLILRLYPLTFFRYKYDLNEIKAVRVVDYAISMAFSVWVIKGNGQARMFKTIKIPAAAINTFLADLENKGVKVDYQCFKRKKN